MSLNKVILIGTIVRTPEIKEYKAGSNFSKFSLLCERTYSLKTGEEKKEHCYVDCTVWMKEQLEVLKDLTEGSEVLVEGRLKAEKWNDDGKDRYKLIVDISHLVALGKTSNPLESSLPF